MMPSVSRRAADGHRCVGVGIELVRASGNRIAKNTVTGIRHREPFLGHFVFAPPEWAGASGSGIWISPGSDEKEIVGNTFDDIAACAVYLTGDRNVVEARAASESVCDLGAGDQVRGPDGTELRDLR